MKNKTYLLIAAFILALVIGNLMVLSLGQVGILFAAIFLIPFDFAIRCLFQEQWQGKDLIFRLGILVITASVITYFINDNSHTIALASAIAFIFAQLTASIFYQEYIQKTYLVKVNGSDLIAIIVDSSLFQMIAFDAINFNIVVGQIMLKIIGGIFWYWLLFVKYKLQDSLLAE